MDIHDIRFNIYRTIKVRRNELDKQGLTIGDVCRLANVREQAVEEL